jgi:phospholipid-translocating ATPase
MDKITLNASSKVSFSWLLEFLAKHKQLFKCLTNPTSFCYLLLKESCTEQVKAWLQKMNDKPTHASSQPPQNKQTKYGLIIDGQTLHYALEYPLALEFLVLAKSCEAVVCCRAAPVQKVSTR